MADLEGSLDAGDGRAIERSLSDPERFVEVFERHFSLIHRFVRVRVGETDADDLTAQTFEIAFRRRRAFDRRRSDARPWLLGIAANLIREHRRSTRRALAGLQRLLDAVAAGPAPDPARRDDATELRAALAVVSEADRDLLFLYACVELSYAECAEALDLPIGTVRSRLHRARERMRRELGDDLHLRLEVPR